MHNMVLYIYFFSYFFFISGDYGSCVYSGNDSGGDADWCGGVATILLAFVVDR